MTDKEIVKKDVQEIIASVFDSPDLIGFTGFENLEEGMLALPFLKIAQPGSGEIVATPIEGLKTGDFFNSLTKKVYGNHINIIVLSFDRSFIEWGDKTGQPPVNRYTSDEMKTQAAEGNYKVVDGYRYFRDPTNKQTEAQETYTFAIVLPDFIEDGILFLSMKSLGIKYAKNIIKMSLAKKINRGGSLYSARFAELVWTLATEKNINENNQVSYQLGKGKAMSGAIAGTIYDAEWTKAQPALGEALRFVKDLSMKKVDMSAAGEPVDDGIPI